MTQLIQTRVLSEVVEPLPSGSLLPHVHIVRPNWDKAFVFLGSKGPGAVVCLCWIFEPFSYPTWHLAFSISAVSLWIMRFSSLISSLVRRRVSPCRITVAFISSHCGEAQMLLRLRMGHATQ